MHFLTVINVLIFFCSVCEKCEIQDFRQGGITGKNFKSKLLHSDHNYFFFMKENYLSSYTPDTVGLHIFSKG